MTKRFKITGDYSEHNLPIGTVVRYLRYDPFNDVDFYVKEGDEGPEGFPVALDSRDLYQLAGPILECDLCGTPVGDNRDDLMIMDSEPFEVPGVIISHAVTWGACFPCSDLITADNWEGLIDRSQSLYSYRGLQSIANAATFGALRQHVKLPLRKWRPEDYALPESS